MKMFKLDEGNFEIKKTSKDVINILELFISHCSRGMVGLIPNKHKICLTCLREELKLKDSESICLQCGERYSYSQDRHVICPSCLKN